MTFDPPQTNVWADGRPSPESVVPPVPPDARVTASVTFFEPGTYIPPGLADDGGQTSGVNVTVTVTP